jgi:Protease inhibitor Inh
MPTMKRPLYIVVAAVLIHAAAWAQSPPLGESAKGMIGTWEFSNAEHDKVCTLTFKNERAAVGFALSFDANCAALFPLTRDVAGWKFPDNDLLYLLDANGKALVEFSEAEDGIYEAPTPGLGVLLLQPPGAAAGTAALKPEQVAGAWALKRGEGKPLCIFALTAAASHDGFVLTVQPGCDAGIAKLGLAQWRLDNGQLLLMPARGEAWRFEEIDDATWRRLPDRPDQLTLVRQ